VFRGITIAGMILVNNPGTWRAVYPPLAHADWHGWTPTDLIFPFFLFIVGAAIPLGLGRRLARGEGRRDVVRKIVLRALVIFGLGLVLAGFPRFELADIRIMGVLQRIALCYLAASAVFLAVSWRAQVLVAGALLLGYWGLMTLVPVPGFGAGDLGKEGNLAAYVDRAVLGRHIWRAGRVYDPEGLLSTLPAIATTLLGVLAGQWIGSGRPAPVITRGMLGSGIVLLGLGLAWGQWFPINKSLWTSSYVLFTGGVALLLLGALHWCIEIAGVDWWTPPFVVLGVNALAAFVLSTLLARILVLAGWHRPLYERLFAPWASPPAASLAFAAAYVLLWLAVMALLHRKRLFLTI
jgi:predicted acyltransferase